MWSGYEFDYREKTPDWYWAVGIIVVSMAAASFIYQNPLFGVFIILAGVFLLMTAKKEPQLIDYELTEKGLLINGKLRSHMEFHAFYVTDHKYSPPKLLLQTNRLSSPILIIPIETDYVDAKTIREFLLDYVPEEKIHEPLSLKFMEFLGF